MFMLRWLWKNMKGDRAIYCFALCLTLICQSMYIITPYITQGIIDTFLVGEEAAENLRRGADQLADMLYAALGGRVREISHAADLQRAALHFHQVPFAAPLHIEIDTGIPISIFGNYPVVSPEI